MTWVGVKWPEKCWYAVKQNNQPINYLNLMTCKTELFEIELFDHLTLCKQMTDV